MKENKYYQRYVISKYDDNFDFNDIWTNEMSTAGSLDQESWYIKNNKLYVDYSYLNDSYLDEWCTDTSYVGNVILCSNNINDILFYILDNSLGNIFIYLNKKWIKINKQSLYLINNVEHLKIQIGIKTTNLIYEQDDWWNLSNDSTKKFWSSLL